MHAFSLSARVGGDKVALAGATEMVAGFCG